MSIQEHLSFPSSHYSPKPSKVVSVSYAILKYRKKLEKEWGQCPWSLVEKKKEKEKGQNLEEFSRKQKFEKSRIANIESNTHEIQEPNYSTETKIENIEDFENYEGVISNHVKIQDSIVKDVIVIGRILFSLLQ